MKASDVKPKRRSTVCYSGCIRVILYSFCVNLTKRFAETIHSTTSVVQVEMTIYDENQATIVRDYTTKQNATWCKCTYSNIKYQGQMS